MTPQQNQDAQYRFQLAFWIVFVVWTGMYFAVLHVVQPAHAAPDPAFENTVLIISVILVAASVVVKRYSITTRRAELTEVSRRVRFMLALVFSEAAALFGVAVWSVTGSCKAYWFLVLGLAGMLYHIPRRAE
jgi:glucan phosphoethanolaminetransferase (alkaline phosphatase superfamily)